MKVSRARRSLGEPRPLAIWLCVSTILLAACGGSGSREGAAAAADGLQAQADDVNARVIATGNGAHAGMPVHGRIHALWEGREQQWDITTLADTTRMSAGMVTDVGLGLSVVLSGEASPDTPATEGSFRIEMGFDGGKLDIATRSSAATITLIPHKGIMPPHWVSPENPEIQLEVARFDGQAGRIEGRFKAELCYRAELYSGADRRNCQPVEGRFASDLALEVF